MPCPQTTEYNEAIQNLRSCVSDEELREGEPAIGSSGMPRPFSGNFADVYKVHCPKSGNTWAVKCFTKDVSGLRERYREISAHLDQARLPFMVEFQYVEPGIRAGGQWVPFLKMRWVEGLTLNQFVSDFLDKPKTLHQLLQLWVKLSVRLREANVAHADLQHGNVLLVPAGERGELALRLIDYDGMYVPALAGKKSGELGHPSYQHPQRLREGIYSRDVDRFSHLAIYSAIRCLLAGGRPLWKRFNNDDNLLFREADFRKPGNSEAFRALWSLPDDEARTLAGRLVLATQTPLHRVPLLEEVLSNGSVAPLSAAEEREVSSLLKASGPAISGPLRITPLRTDAVGQAASGVRAPVSESPGQSEPWWAAGAALPTPGGSPTTPAAPGGRPAGASPQGSVVGGVGAKSHEEAPTGVKAVLAALEGRFGLPPATSLALGAAAAVTMVLALLLALRGSRTADRTPETETAATTSPVEESIAASAPSGSSPAPSPPAAPERREARSLTGHGDSVLSVALAPNGRTVASASEDRTVKLWDAETGQELRDFTGHSAYVLSVAFSPDGRTLASASADQTVKLWDAETGRELHTLRGHGRCVFSAVFSPDGRTLASAGQDRTVRLWDVEAGRELRRFTGHTDFVRSVVFSPDNRTLAGASDDRTVRLWDIENSQDLRHTLAGHSGHVCSVAFSPDGRTLASGSWDKTVKLWDVATGRELRTLAGHSDNVLSVAFSRDGRTLASASEDRTVRLWDVLSGQELRTLADHSGYVCSVAFSADGRTLASASRDKTLRLWPVEPLGPLVEPPVPAPSITTRAKATLASEGDARSMPDVRTLTGHTGYVLSVAFSPNGRTLASASLDRTVKLWDARTGKELRTLTGHTGHVASVAFAPNGRTLASASYDNTVRLWDVQTGMELRTLTGHSREVTSVAFSLDGRTLASACCDQRVKLWDAETGQELRTLTGHGSNMVSPAFSPDGRTLACAGSNGTLRLWDAATGQELRTLTGHGLYVSSVAFSPDGRTLASASQDRTVKLWDAETGQELRTLTGHTEHVYAVVFSPNGRTLASGGHDQTVRLWDADTGQELRTLTGHTGYVHAVAFSPDGRTLAGAGGDTTVKLWDAPLRGLPFGIFPIDLPERGEGELGKIDTGPDTPWQLAIVDGDKVFGDARQFLPLERTEAAGKSAWPVRVSAAGANESPTEVAQFWRDGQSLRFRWMDGVPSALANPLRLCKLSMRAGEAEARAVPLAAPQAAPPAALPLDAPAATSQIRLAWLPESSKLRAQVTHLAGLRDYEIIPSDPVDLDTHVTLSFTRTLVRTKTQRPMLALAVAFSVKGGALNVDVVPADENSASALKSLPRRGLSPRQQEQLDAALKKLQDPDSLRGTVRKRFEDMADNLMSREAWGADFYEAMKTARIHYRVFAQVGDRMVEVANSRADPKGLDKPASAAEPSEPAGAPPSSPAAKKLEQPSEEPSSEEAAEAGPVTQLVQPFRPEQILNYIGIPAFHARTWRVGGRVRIQNRQFTIQSIRVSGTGSRAAGTLASFDIVVLSEKTTQTYPTGTLVEYLGLARRSR